MFRILSFLTADDRAAETIGFTNIGGSWSDLDGGSDAENNVSQDSSSPSTPNLGRPSSVEHLTLIPAGSPDRPQCDFETTHPTGNCTSVPSARGAISFPFGVSDIPDAVMKDMNDLCHAVSIINSYVEGGSPKIRDQDSVEARHSKTELSSFGHGTVSDVQLSISSPTLDHDGSPIISETEQNNVEYAVLRERSEVDHLKPDQSRENHESKPLSPECPSGPTIREVLTTSRDLASSAALKYPGRGASSISNGLDSNRPEACNFHELNSNNSEYILENALQKVAYILVRADRHESVIWDTFMELKTMRVLVDLLRRTSCDTPANPGPRKSAVDEAPGCRASIDPSARTVAPIANSSLNQPPIPSLGQYPSLSNARCEDFSTTCRIQIQVLRTLSILFQSITKRESLFCLLAANHVNDILSFDFMFENDELMLYFMSAVKSIALKLDNDIIQFFFDSRSGTFPLYTTIVRFHSHPEAMVRIAVRNITLSIYSLRNPSVHAFTLQDQCGYFSQTVAKLAKMCGEVARAFEYLLDDGRELRRTVSRRMGRLRQNIRMPMLIAELHEIEGIVEYLSEVTAIPDAEEQGIVLTELVTSRLFAPFFLPIASRASPTALALARGQWTLRPMQSEARSTSQPALPLLDAAARLLVMGFLLNIISSPLLGESLLSVVVYKSARFDHCSIVHGIKAMIGDMFGVERVTHISLCTLEALIRSIYIDADALLEIGCTLSGNPEGEHEPGNLSSVAFQSSDLALENPDTDSLEEVRGSRGNVPMSTFRNPRPRYQDGRRYSDLSGFSNSSSDGLVMNLSDFSVPLTPTSPSSNHALANTPRSQVDLVDVSESLSSSHFADDYSTMPSSPYSTPSFHDQVTKDELILQEGNASLKDIICSILLVVRKREIRSARMVQAVLRVICGIALRTGNWLPSLTVVKSVVDEIAGSILDFLRNPRTTIVAIETAFDSFRAVSAETCTSPVEFAEVSTFFLVENLSKMASVLPPGSGRRRRTGSLLHDRSPPIEYEDAVTFFMMLRTFEYILSIMSRRIEAQPPDPNKCQSSLQQVVAAILQDEDAATTYLDKRRALAEVAATTKEYILSLR